MDLTQGSFTRCVFTARKRSLGQGNIFIGVCQEFCSQGGAWSRGGVPGLGVPGPGGACSWEGECSQGVPGGDPPHQTATAAGGTHPTGMHSCSVNETTIKNGLCGYL